MPENISKCLHLSDGDFANLGWSNVRAVFIAIRLLGGHKEYLATQDPKLEAKVDRPPGTGMFRAFCNVLYRIASRNVSYFLQCVV